MRRFPTWPALAAAFLFGGAAKAQLPAAFLQHYGDNPQAGRVFTHDGVRLYYETYGSGPPLLIIHGNGASIASLSGQIDDFKARYRVIVMDSRDHGKSGDSPVPLTFEAMSDDLAALLDETHAGPAYVLGWSDGGIEALLLGIRHPDKVRMIAAMAANLEPDGTFPEFLGPSPAAGSTPPADAKRARSLRVERLDRDEPHIRPEALEAITAPTLVLASDHDAIRDEHTLLIYHHLKNAQLAIFPDATHMIPIDDPARFNATVERFFSTPFVPKDRLGDLLKTLRKFSKPAS
jgi:pimeloyl-ACP methyl ester carboxylesterase